MTAPLASEAQGEVVPVPERAGYGVVHDGRLLDDRHPWRIPVSFHRRKAQKAADEVRPLFTAYVVSADLLYAGADDGLYRSLDGGETWALADNGLPAVGVWFMTEVEDEVVLGTHGLGIWSLTMPQLIEGKLYRPLVDALYQGPDGLLYLLTDADDGELIRLRPTD